MKKNKMIVTCVLIVVLSVFMTKLGKADRNADNRDEIHSEKLSMEADAAYYMRSHGNHIIVYNKDHTVYEYTDLQEEFLPEKIVYELNQGIFFRDQEDLYEFLETYSS